MCNDQTESATKGQQPLILDATQGRKDYYGTSASDRLTEALEDATRARVAAIAAADSQLNSTLASIQERVAFRLRALKKRTAVMDDEIEALTKLMLAISASWPGGANLGSTAEPKVITDDEFTKQS